MKSITSKLNPLVKIIDEYYSYKGIDFIPYNRLKDFAKETNNSFVGLGRILATHVRGEIPPHVKAEVDLNIFKSWEKVLAGDLHSYSNSQLNILYPGSPVTTSFHRNAVETGVIIIDTNTLVHEFIKLDLPQLIRKTIQVGDDMPATSPDHTIYEVEGDMSQLANLEDNELMDKKVVKRNTDDTTLILNPEMSIEQEISEYLEFILELPQDTIDDCLKEYRDCIKNSTI